MKRKPQPALLQKKRSRKQAAKYPTPSSQPPTMTSSLSALGADARNVGYYKPDVSLSPTPLRSHQVTLSRALHLLPVGMGSASQKNEASIFFPPAKIEGARGHNECRNATRITMDMDHKPARKSGGWNEEKSPSQESVPIRNFIRRLNI